MIQPNHGGNLTWAAAVAGCPVSAILDFSASINPLGPPVSALESIQRHLYQLRVYPDPDYGELRRVLSQLHDLEPEWVLPGNGAAELLTWAALELSQTSVTYLLTPAFSDYWRALHTFNIQGIGCPWQGLQDQGENEGKFPFQMPLIAPGTSVGLVLNSPHNPTGESLSLESILPILANVALAVVDEAFLDFVPPEEQESVISRIRELPNVVVLRSLTKFYSLPGLRLGYAVGHPQRLRQWQQWRDPWPVNALAAAAGVAVVQDREFQQQTWQWLDQARPKLLAGLSQLPGLFPYPSRVNFVLVRSEWPVDQLQVKLLKSHQILIRDCLSFPELGNYYFRVAVRTEAENQQLLAGLALVLEEERGRGGEGERGRGGERRI